MTCEQKLKQFFHNKIDWKFFNYLKDKIVHFEDAGKAVFISVAIFVGKNDYKSIYLYVNGNDVEDTEYNEYWYNYLENQDGYAKDINADVMCDYYALNGLFYRVAVENKRKMDLYNIFKDKSKIVEIDTETSDEYDDLLIEPLY